MFLIQALTGTTLRKRNKSLSQINALTVSKAR